MDKVKGYTNLTKENGSVCNNDTESYQQRKQVIKNRQRLNNIEAKQQELDNRLEGIEDNINAILDLLRGK